MSRPFWPGYTAGHGGISRYWLAVYPGSTTPPLRLPGKESEPISRAGDPATSPIHHMGVNHGGADILMVQQFLDGAKGGALFQRGQPRAAFSGGRAEVPRKQDGPSGLTLPQRAVYTRSLRPERWAGSIACPRRLPWLNPPFPQTRRCRRSGQMILPHRGGVKGKVEPEASRDRPPGSWRPTPEEGIRGQDCGTAVPSPGEW